MARLEDCALERAILGEERVVVRGGEVVATWRRHDTALLMFLLRNRRRERFGDGGAIGREALAELRREARRGFAMADEAKARAVGRGIEQKLAGMMAERDAARARSAPPGYDDGGQTDCQTD